MYKWKEKGISDIIFIVLIQAFLDWIDPQKIAPKPKNPNEPACVA